MLVELGLVEQRLKAVYEVLDGALVIDVAKRYGVTRQTVHVWLKKYATNGMSGLVNKTSRPDSCPHQMAAVVEARIVELWRANVRWGPQRILHQLERDGVSELPGRSSVYRCLVRHGLIDPQARKRRKSDYKPLPSAVKRLGADPGMNGWCLATPAVVASGCGRHTGCRPESLES